MQQKLLNVLKRLFPAHGKEEFDNNHDILWAHGREKDALFYAALYLSEFVEVEGSVLQTTCRMNADRFPKDFMEAKESGKQLQELEKSFNYVETSHLFNSGLNEELTDEDDKVFAECFAEAWRSRLALLYPTRRFKVTVFGPTESGDAYAVSFYEIRT